ncbi:MAG: Lrp/AsnC family transcriptional regulator [Cohaesibacter sp.]|jgi:DNA-binding Lrp family transcriptional regulator|nr:Lrp/AsnC family transcriptional regulator [Cohaesibacter sp.]
MDKIERKLLTLLQQDGRRPSVDLAKDIGLSVSATNERVRKLIDQGIVRKVEAVLDPEKLGMSVTAFLYVDLDYSKDEQEFVLAISNMAQVLEVHHVTGAHSYLIKVRCRSTKELNEFISQSLKQMDQVVSTETQIVLETAKETLALPL